MVIPFFAKMLESGMKEAQEGIKFPEEHYDAVAPVLMYLTEKKNLFDDIPYDDLCGAYLFTKKIFANEIEKIIHPLLITRLSEFNVKTSLEMCAMMQEEDPVVPQFADISIAGPAVPMLPVSSMYDFLNSYPAPSLSPSPATLPVTPLPVLPVIPLPTLPVIPQVLPTPPPEPSLPDIRVELVEKSLGIISRSNSFLREGVPKLSEGAIRMLSAVESNEYAFLLVSILLRWLRYHRDSDLIKTVDFPVRVFHQSRCLPKPQFEAFCRDLVEVNNADLTMKLITVLATPMFTFKRESFSNPDRVSVSYLDFDINRFGIEEPMEHVVPCESGRMPGPQGRYIRCRMTYGGHPFALKIPNVKIYSVNHGYTDHKIEGLFVGFSGTLSLNEQKFIQVMEAIYQAMIPYLDQHKRAIKIPHFSPKDARVWFKSPLYYPRDKVTGELIPNKNPYFGIKLKKGRSSIQEETILKSSVDDRVIEFESFKPGMTIEDPEINLSGYVGSGKASIPIRLIRGYAEVMPE